MIAESSSFRVYCAPPSSSERQLEDKHGDHHHHHHHHHHHQLANMKIKPGGWKAVSYILGNETFERLATMGLLANFMVYLIRELHLTQASAANILNIWGGVTNFAPLVGAFISDAFAGRFNTIAFASFATLMGMLTVTLTAWVPDLHPPRCDVTKPPFGQCQQPNKSQMAVLLTGLCLLSVGSGGIRSCSIPFGVDQFDATTQKGIKGINSFFNWYYTSFTVVILISQTGVVYIQDQVSWVIGFGIPTVLMLCSIVLFFVGTRVYVFVEPDGSIFSGIFRVFLAAYKKRKLMIPEGGNNVVYYNPASKLEGTVSSKLPLTSQFRFLNKAAVIMDKELKPNETPLSQTAMIEENELNPDGTPINQWNLCSVQQVEDVKCLIKVIPVWASGIIGVIALIQQTTFTISQAMQMNRHLGPKFQVPPGSIGVISMITVGLLLPFYDRILVPSLRRFTKVEEGIKMLQRIGIGMVFSVLSMVAAGIVEKKRRTAAEENTILSVFWLSPQLILLGFCEAFLALGQIELFNKEFPEHMKSIANALAFCSLGVANYLSSLMITIIHRSTRKNGRPDWLTSDINGGRLDYFYYLLAGMGAVNFLYFLYCAHIYRYKGNVELEEKPYPDAELASPIKS